MKWIKNIAHPHAYILFFIVISLLALIPNGLGWRIDMEDYPQEYIGLTVFYVIFYLLGYYIPLGTEKPEKREISISMINFFHITYFILLGFFIIKFIYVGGIPLISDSPFLRTKMGKLGGFVDYPTKAISLLGIVAYYFYISRKNSLYIFQFIISIVLNILFAERSLIVFTLVGALILYVQYHKVSLKTFGIVLFLGLLMLFFIGWVQIVRLGGKNNLDRSGKKSALEVGAWVIQGDLTGSQKFGAYVVDKLHENYLYGKYTFGTYLAVFVPNFEEHGAEYLQKEFTEKRTAQSAAIPYSYFMDFGYLSLIFPLIIGMISRYIYLKFKTLNSPFYNILYPTYFFGLLWSVRSGNFPIEPKFIYYLLVLIFVFNPHFHKRINNEIITLLRLIFIGTLAVSFIALLIRW